MSEKPEQAVLPGIYPGEEVSTAIAAGSVNAIFPKPTLHIGGDVSDVSIPETQSAAEKKPVGECSEGVLPGGEDDELQVTEAETTPTEQGTLPLADEEANADDASSEASTSNETSKEIDKKEHIQIEWDKEITLPNLTLGRGQDYIEYPLIPGTTLNGEYAPDGRQWMDTKEVRIEKTDNGFRVTPKEGVTGTVSFDVFYNVDKKTRFHLTINPDPWSLWKSSDPEDPQLFGQHDKDRLENHHESKINYEDEFFSVVGASRRGRSHEHYGTFRDDDLGFWCDKDTGRYVFIVADGAGSARFSREGSRMAIEFLKQKLPANLTVARWNADGENPKKDGNVGQLLAALARGAFDHIAKFVKEENESHPDNKWEVRDFNTTLLIAAVKRDSDGGLRLVSFSIGDGAIAWYDGEESSLMCAPDSGEFSGGTRFLTMRSIWEKASKDWTAFCMERVFCTRIPPEKVMCTRLFLMTDGVSDPWFETDAALNDKEKWREFAEDILLGEGENKAALKNDDSVDVKAGKLLNWLTFKIPGNHDDRTLIVVTPKNTTDLQIVKKEDGNV